MIVGGRYELSAAELQPGTFDGRHLGLQRPIQLHVLGRNRSTNMVVLERMNRLPEQRRRMIIDAGEQDGLTYVVTWPLESSRSLMQWLGEDQGSAPSPPVSAPPAAVAPPPAVAAAPVAEPPIGEFTRMFSAGSRGRVPADPLVPNPPAAPPREPTAGEFSRMFSAPPRLAEPPPLAVSPALPAAPPPERPVGEFTRMFSAPPGGKPEPERPAAPPPRSAPQEPGEFTRFFSPEVAARKDEPPPLSLGKPADPLSFTQVFQRALADPAPRVDSPLPMSPPLAPPPAISTGTLPGGPAPGGTSDYTRVVGSPQLTGTPPPFPPKPQITPPSIAKPSLPVAPPAMPVAKTGFPLVRLVGILAALLVLAVLFVAVLVIKNR